MTYYKATRSDGTDFHSGKILYEVGKRVRPHRSDHRQICGPGYLHASDEMAMTLVGGSWPCKLFEVDGKPEVGFNTTHPHKGGFRQLTVVKELPAHWALGPNGLIVSKVIELGAAWGAARDAAWGAAWGAARGAAIALLVQDLISKEHFDKLYGPWLKVIGELR